MSVTFGPTAILSVNVKDVAKAVEWYRKAAQQGHVEAQFKMGLMNAKGRGTPRDYAKAHGHPDIVVNPHLLFNVVLGLSVEDCSEIGGPFLGVYDLVYDRPIYPGTTVIAKTETIDKRLSSSDPKNGIVTWRTEGFAGDGKRIVGFRRSNLVRLRHPGGSA